MQVSAYLIRSEINQWEISVRNQRKTENEQDGIQRYQPMGRNRQETFGIFAKQLKMNGQHQQNNILHECLHLVHMDGVTKTSTIRNDMKGKIPKGNQEETGSQ